MRRILYLISDTGGGHRASARAIVATMKMVEKEPNVHEIVDVFTLGRPFVNFLFGKSYGPMIKKTPWLYQFIFFLFNNDFVFHFAFNVNYYLLGPRLAKYIADFKPDVIVSLHPLVNHLVVCALREDGQLGKIPVLTFVLDPITLHRSWVCPDVDRLIVATPEAKQLTISYGMPAEKIDIIGLPVDPRFSQPSQSKEQIRKELALQENLFTILIMGGGDGIGNMEKFVKGLYSSGLPIQLIVVCGRNKELQESLDEMSKEEVMPMKILGYTQDVPDLMSASDLLLTKAGPGSVAEALLKELPLIIMSYVPGQEEGNVRWAEMEHFVKLVKDPTDIGDVVETLMEGPELNKMRESMQKLRRPGATLEIVHLILDYANGKRK